uniref:Uncharacterized protein n=1 Tax=Anaerolinea thermolimosa TaxID=229919 RepID=A0A7C4KGD5_9CHLR
MPMKPEEVLRRIAARQEEASFRVPAGEGRLLAFLAERGTVLERRYANGEVDVRVRIGSADRARAERMLLDATRKVSPSEGEGAPPE